jgi:hypothetical protein
MEIWTILTTRVIWQLSQFKRDFIETPQIVLRGTSSIPWLKTIKVNLKSPSKANGLVRTLRCSMETSKISMNAKMHSYKSRVIIEKMLRNNSVKVPSVLLSLRSTWLQKLFARVILWEATRTCTTSTIGSINRIERRTKSSRIWRQQRFTRNTLSSQRLTRYRKPLLKIRGKSSFLKIWATQLPNKSLIKKSRNISKKKSKSTLSSLNFTKTNMKMSPPLSAVKVKNSPKILRKN